MFFFGPLVHKIADGLDSRVSGPIYRQPIGAVAAYFTRSRSLISALGDPRSSHSYLCVYLGNHSP
jgi:hypothetical protein